MLAYITETLYVPPHWQSAPSEVGAHTNGSVFPYGTGGFIRPLRGKNWVFKGYFCPNFTA
ncbi:hypothetical protein GHA01_29020 [Novacetimonas hansenii]|uniref:Uncharacterized protein n=1 Tax=Novacetimonas hansenii TaxID=436 RepID=A0ABQ0SIH7_NOVHA|nr:hypothetical protein GHA01_29020 [Novacetimonas hansenii]